MSVVLHGYLLPIIQTSVNDSVYGSVYLTEKSIRTQIGAD